MNLLRRTFSPGGQWRVFRCVCILFLLVLVGDSAFAQSCDVFVNPSDGSDTNPGTQFQPLRSFELAFLQTPNGGKLCLSSGEYYQGSDADGITLNGTNKSVTIRLQSFGGNQEIILSEKSLAVDVGSGTITFERAGTESIVLGKGRINSNSLSPSGLNFLHTVSVQSGILAFGTVPVLFEQSVGNTLYINPDNSQKTAPSTASISLAGNMTGSALGFAAAPRSWKIEPTTSAASRTLSLPALSPQASLTLNNNAAVVFSSPIDVGSSGSFQILSTASGSLSFSSGLVLRGGASFSHAGPQSLSLSIQVIGTGQSKIEFLGTGTQTISSLTYASEGQSSLQVRGGTTLFPNGGTLRGTLLVTSELAAMAGLSLEATSTTEPLLTLSGRLTLSGDAFMLLNPLAGAAPVEILLPAIVSNGSLSFNGPFSVIGGGTLPLTVLQTTNLSLSQIIVPNPVQLVSGSRFSLQSNDVHFQDTITISGGTLSIGSSAVPTIGKLIMSSGLVTGNASKIKIGSLFTASGGILDGLGLTFSEQSAEVASVQSLSSLETTGTSLTIRNDVLVAGTCSSSSSTVTVLPMGSLRCGILDMTSESKLILQTGAQAFSSSSMTFNGSSLEGQAGTAIHVFSTLDLGSALHDVSSVQLHVTGSEHTLTNAKTSVFKTLFWGKPSANLTIQGDVGFVDAQSFLDNTVSLGPNSLLRIRSNLQTKPSKLLFTGTSQLILEGTSSVDSPVSDIIVLPPTRVEAASVSFHHATRIQGSLTQNGGVIDVLNNVPLVVSGSLSGQTGSVNLLEGSTLDVFGSISLDSHQLILQDGSELQARAGTSFMSTTVSASNATLHLSGSGILSATNQLLVKTFRVSGAQTNVTLALPQSIQVASTLQVDAGSQLDMGESRVILGSLNTFGTLAVEGRISGSPVSDLSLIGDGGVWTGGGRVDNLRLLFSSSNDVLGYWGSDAWLGEKLTLESGIIDVGEARLHLEAANDFSVFVSIEEQSFSGRLAASLVFNINPENQPISLNLSGQVTGFPSVDEYFRYGPLHNLTVSAADVLNSPPIFGVTTTLPVDVAGAFHLEANTFLNAPSITVRGDNAANVLKGRVGRVTFAGSGTIDGNKSGTATELRFMGEDYQVTNISRATSLELQSGRLELYGPAPLIVEESVTLSGGSLELRTGLRLNRLQGVATFSAAAIPVELGAGSFIDFQSRTNFSVDPLSLWTLTDAGAMDGFVNIRNSTTFSGPGGIPRLRLSEASSDMTLQADLSVFDTIESLAGTVRLGNYHLNFLGSIWQHGGSRFIGDQTSLLASVNLIGSSIVTLAAPMLIEFCYFSLNAGSGTISFKQSLPGSLHSVSIPNRGFSAESGVIDLGRTDIQVQGNATPLIRLQNIRFTSTESYALPITGTVVKPVQNSFPFSDAQVGELIMASVSGGKLLSTGNTSIAALRVENDVIIDAASDPIQVAKRLVFGQGGARVELPATGAIQLASGAKIIRRGRGVLSHAVVFEGPAGVYYDLDDGSVTGQNRNFQQGELLSGFEIPPSSIGVLDFAVLAGNTGSTLNRVKINRDLRIQRSATLWGGEVDWSASTVHFEQGATLSILEIDESARALLTSNKPYTAGGPIDLFARALTSSIIISPAVFPTDIAVDSLVFDVGDPTSSLTPTMILSGAKTAKDIIVNAKQGSSLNMSGGSLLATSALSIPEGRVFSDPSASLETSGTFNLGATGVIDGNISISVSGHSTIEGQMQALGFTTSGNVNLTGPWQQATSLELRGDMQEFSFNTAEITIGNLTRNAPNGGSATISGPDGSRIRITQHLQLSSGHIILNASALVLESQTGVVASSGSWVSGPMSRTIPAGYTGSISFPIGFAASPRPIDLVITNPLLTSSVFGVRLDQKEPRIETGLPLAVGANQILDTDTFFWTLTSSVNFATSQTFSLSATAEGLDQSAVALLTRAVGTIGTPWQTDNLSSGGTLRSAILNQGLSPVGMRISPGKTVRNGNRAFVQLVDSRPTGQGSGADIYLDGDLWLFNAPSGSPAPVIPVSVLSGSTGTLDVIVSKTGEPSTSATARSGLLSLETDRVSFLGLSDNQMGAPIPISSRVFPRDPGILVFNAAPESELVNIEEMWPEAAALVNQLPGMSFSSQIAPSILFSTLKISSTSGAVAYSKYQPLSSDTGPFVLVVSPTLRNFLLTPVGQKISPVDATDVDDSASVPQQFEMLGSYPNPASSRVSFTSVVPAAGRLEIEWVDVAGRTVLKVEEGIEAAAASHETTVDTAILPSGLYLTRITFRSAASSTTVTRKVVVVR